MSEKIKQKTVFSCWIIFAILIFVHGFEAIVLRMDETVLGENCINVYKRKKGSSRGLDILGIIKHFLFRARTDHHLIHSEYRVYRCPDLMGHVCKELRF